MLAAIFSTACTVCATCTAGGRFYTCAAARDAGGAHRAGSTRLAQGGLWEGCLPTSAVKVKCLAAPAVLHEHVSNLLHIAQIVAATAANKKQRRALCRQLRAYPELLDMQPATLQSKPSLLQQRLQQQVDLEPELVQKLICKHRIVLNHHIMERLTGVLDPLETSATGIVYKRMLQC
ncbi:hypothetical protein COO60DRAFT_340349 [Scenedesmus sp. NREL 46B-D3]|nr:hypothetical protein COO60DRAFT_340349 [Scenedesmus sp. NREL 46B-D3]